MMRLVSDENFNGDTVRGMLRRRPDLELVRVQDVGLMQTPDPDIAGVGRWPGACTSVS